MAQMNGMEWKSGISQIPHGMAEKRRKCGIIPPIAEWLACLKTVQSIPANSIINLLLLLLLFFFLNPQY